MRGEVWIKEQLGGEGGETTIMIYYMRKNIFLVKTKKLQKLFKTWRKPGHTQCCETESCDFFSDTFLFY